MIILLGVPGSGKSTQGQLLVDRGKLRWVSMGEIFRGQITDDRQKQMLAGKLLADNEVIEVLEKSLGKLGDNPQLVLDGFPRTVDQAKWLVTQNNNQKLVVSCVVSLDAAREVVEKRLMSRGRSDDQKETIDNRFDIYELTFLPVIEVLKTGGIPVLSINADQTVQEISKDIIEALGKLNIEA